MLITKQKERFSKLIASEQTIRQCFVQQGFYTVIVASQLSHSLFQQIRLGIWSVIVWYLVGNYLVRREVTKFVGNDVQDTVVKSHVLYVRFLVGVQTNQREVRQHFCTLGLFEVRNFLNHSRFQCFLTRYIYSVAVYVHITVNSDNMLVGNHVSGEYIKQETALLCEELLLAERFLPRDCSQFVVAQRVFQDVVVYQTQSRLYF